MFTPRHISPILDGFTLGEAISQHDGSRCFRATQNFSGQPFIVKIISLPASTAQLDALLMSGAFSTPAEVNAFFKDRAKDVLRNVQVLRHMATVGGYLDYDCVQVVASEDGKGYEIYMLAPLRQTLPQQLQREDLTQTDVVNLALDLCAALTVCRRSGYCYANLNPGNVFKRGSHYYIGDLGFLPLYEMGKIPLPEQYRSSYSPPELMDGSRPINDTADVYALGLILDQAYNAGALPGNDAVFGRLLLPPKYADYEMAEIILRACAPDPSIRWQGPEQIGLALMRYTQRNGMRNDPVIPPIVQQMQQASAIEPFLPEDNSIADAEDAPEMEESWDTPAFTPPVRRRTTRKKGFSLNLKAIASLFPKRRSHSRKSGPRKFSLGWIAIGLLGAILAIELALFLWLF